jgi:uncharacterized repeat protein (TIGR02543 family)
MRAYFLILFVVCNSLFGFSKVSKSLIISKAGTLNAQFAEPKIITELTLTGSINAVDMFYMRDSMPLLELLDLENTNITASGLNPENKLPDFSFYNPGLNISKTNLKSIKLPINLKVIGQMAFKGCTGLSGYLSIPDSVSFIGDETFYNCSGLNGTLNIPSLVTYIGNGAFEGCTGFTGSLNLPKIIIYIGGSSFENCSGFTGQLTIPDSLTSIHNGTFSGCTGFTGGLTIPKSITYIGSLAFSNCSGLNGPLTLPNSLIYIGNSAFHECSGFTGDLTIPNSVTNLGIGAFFNCTGFAGNLTLSNSIPILNESVFEGCSGLSGSLTIPNSVKYINNNAFNKCSSLSGSLTIPSSVTTIKDMAFANCSNLSQIIVAQITPPAIPSNTFTNVNKKTCQLMVPAGSIASYKAANCWKDYTKYIEAIFVTFQTWGGNSQADQILHGKTIIAPPDDPKRTGYTFIEWYKDPDLNHVWNFATDIVETNTSLYAKWAVNSYLVTINLSNENSSLYTIAFFNKKITEPAKPINTGHTFAGWFKEPTFVNNWNFNTDVVTANTTLYAKWTINTYTISFNSKGGNSIASITADYNTTITAPTPPVKKGYFFGGWYIENTYKNEWNFKTNVVIDNNTLYAKWNSTSGIAKQINTAESISVSPNPTKNYIFIKGTDLQLITIYSVTGLIEIQEHLKGNEQSLSLEKLHAGIYLMNIKTNNAVHTLKLLKE